MTKELSALLKRRLTGLSFFDVVAGIAQPVIDVRFNDDIDTKIARKIPVSYDFVGGKSAYLGMERQLVPDKSKKSIIYFEDWGSSIDTGRGVPAGAKAYNSKIRLVCWMNKDKFQADKYAELTAYAIDMITQCLVSGRAINEAGLTRLFIEVTGVPIQDAGIFSRYNYAEEVTQYLRPPFEYFAIDLQCKYRLSAVTCSGHKYSGRDKIVPIIVFIVDNPDNSTITLKNGDVIRKNYAPGLTLTILDNFGKPYLKGKKLGSSFVVDNGYFQNEPFDSNTGVIDHTQYGGFSSANNPGAVSFDVIQTL